MAYKNRYNSRSYRPPLIHERMLIPADFCGRIIGPKATVIRRLKEMPGIQNVFLDSRNPMSNGMVELKISGRDRVSVDAVVQEVHLLLNQKSNRGRAEISRLFLDYQVKDVGNCTLELANVETFPVSVNVHKTCRSGNVYAIEKLRKPDLDLNIDNLNLADHDSAIFQEYDKEAVKATFEEALSLDRALNLEFTVSLGKLLFSCRKHSFNKISLDINSKGQVLKGQLERKELRPFWNTSVIAELTERMIKCLEDDGFQCLNKESPESYTNIHLFAGPENLHASVVLALNSQLQEVEEKQDDRLTLEKKEAIEKILKAKTIGDVLPAGSSLKVSYRKLSLQIHPDKNSHPGATEAFKKLGDAYNRLNNRDSPASKALTVDSPVTSTNSTKPPKVTSVTTNKKKLCTISLLSEKRLDLRGYLKTYDRDESGEGISERIRKVLNECWDQRDAEGGISDPAGQTGIKINMVKQVHHKVYFAKEIKLAGKSEVFEVCVFKMRSKSGNEDWIDTLEMDATIVESGLAKLTGSDLAQRFEYIRDWWENFLY